MNPAAERVRNLALSLSASRADAAALLCSVASELDHGPAGTHLREAAEREAESLRAQGFTVTGARPEVRTAAAAWLIDRAGETLRNWRADGVGPVWRSDGAGGVWYCIADLVSWRDGVSRVVPINQPADVV